MHLRFTKTYDLRRSRFSLLYQSIRDFSSFTICTLLLSLSLLQPFLSLHLIFFPFPILKLYSIFLDFFHPFTHFLLLSLILYLFLSLPLLFYSPFLFLQVKLYHLSTTFLFQKSSSFLSRLILPLLHTLFSPFLLYNLPFPFSFLVFLISTSLYLLSLPHLLHALPLPFSSFFCFILSSLS